MYLVSQQVSPMDCADIRIRRNGKADGPSVGNGNRPVRMGWRRWIRICRTVISQVRAAMF